eukprot:gnl/TRDRNA2_/TRDRNA2_151247_c1_seq1.p1 gnl/TRDRNA2_/TRDRNA2_151247_c1~~gnl/TRDRNA2_/TRDRNA2_151247_c1_seq1.p1  ORF type:complete len:128 (-),score=8.95 gnl/TRDRNA2_/TRDRNA2_151247_c1_seq1:171-554(-)
MVLCETIEIIIPLCYLACFIVGYYGPNAHVLGNVKNSYWQFQAVDNMLEFAMMVCLLAAFDALSVLISGGLLYSCGNLNIWHVYLHIQKDFGIIMALQQAWMLEQSFCVIAVACALDLTFKFDWVYN